jgi:hypothetical protein
VKNYIAAAFAIAFVGGFIAYLFLVPPRRK